ncbi:hypothetical protein PAHAL_6G066400 [Panicum hallii]|uniref:Secreted protein n=1 Tax=Panicum hallii TaxID=206008 RepID=A0A2T8IFF1_9POAL|nr:hypothetical protein PAHAL_6G066400 [Panicum hallii]
MAKEMKWLYLYLSLLDLDVAAGCHGPNFSIGPQGQHNNFTISVSLHLRHTVWQAVQKNAPCTNCSTLFPVHPLPAAV